MTKQTEKIRKQLLELSDAVNAFNSETVQLKIITRIIPLLDELNHTEELLPQAIPQSNENQYRPIDKYQIEFLKDQSPIMSGLKKLAASGYLQTTKTLSEVSNYLNVKEGVACYPRQVKTCLTKMVKTNLICWTTDIESNRLVYINRLDVNPSVFLT